MIGKTAADDIARAYAIAFDAVPTPADRKAAKKLAVKYGSVLVLRVIAALKRFNRDPRAPRIGSVADLESNWLAIARYLQQKAGDDASEL